MVYLWQVIQYHDFFLQKCLKECLLLLPELLKVRNWRFSVSFLSSNRVSLIVRGFIPLAFSFSLQKVEKLKSICLNYAAGTQWLISSSIYLPRSDVSSTSSDKSKPWRSRNKLQALKLTAEDATTATESLL